VKRVVSSSSKKDELFRCQEKKTQSREKEGGKLSIRTSSHQGGRKGSQDLKARHHLFLAKKDMKKAPVLLGEETSHAAVHQERVSLSPTYRKGISPLSEGKGGGSAARSTKEGAKGWSSQRTGGLILPYPKKGLKLRGLGKGSHSAWRACVEREDGVVDQHRQREEGDLDRAREHFLGEIEGEGKKGRSLAGERAEREGRGA